MALGNTDLSVPRGRGETLPKMGISVVGRLSYRKSAQHRISRSFSQRGRAFDRWQHSRDVVVDDGLNACDSQRNYENENY
jgi:hypothetical protein